MSVKVEVLGVEKLLGMFKSMPNRIEAGVKVGGAAVDYALVWEFGRVNIKPGPKTMWSTNALGQNVVLTIQAPTGYIRTNKDLFRQIIQQELAKADLKKLPPGKWQPAIIKAMDRIAQKCTDVIRAAAPVDTGDLRNSIEPAFEGDPLLLEDQAGTFDMGSVSFGG